MSSKKNLPLLCALSASCTFPSSSPSSPSFTWFLPVTSCLTCLFVGFSPCFFPLSSLLWPAWAYCPACHFSLSRTILSSSALSSLLSPLSSLLHLFPSPKGVCPKRLCPTWQHLTTLRPKVVLRSHVVSLFALAPPVIFSRLSYVPPMLLDAWATGYSATSSLGTLLTTECRACSTNDLCCNHCSFFLCLRFDNEGARTFTGGAGNGVTSLWHTVRLILRPPTPFSPYFSLCSLSYPKSWLVHRNLLPKFLYSYTLSLYNKFA